MAICQALLSFVSPQKQHYLSYRPSKSVDRPVLRMEQESHRLAIPRHVRIAVAPAKPWPSPHPPRWSRRCCAAGGQPRCGLRCVRPDENGGHRSGCFFQALRSHRLLDLFDVIEVVSECCVDAGKSDSRELGDDLIERHALVCMPHHGIEHTDAVARDAGLGIKKIL